MLNRAGDTAARALLPALLVALALLQFPLAGHSTRSTCHRISVMRLVSQVGELTPEVDELFHAVTLWEEVTASLLLQHRNYLWALTCVFALAYLLLARERLALRVPVCATAVLAPVAFVAFSRIC
jgi:hypothetical protein